MIILTSTGISIIVNVVMEAYHARRAKEDLGQYSEGMEDTGHRAD